MWASKVPATSMRTSQILLPNTAVCSVSCGTRDFAYGSILLFFAIQVQPHMKKCFDNIKSLTLRSAARHHKTEATAMISSEGELVPLEAPLVLDGPVEVRLAAFALYHPIIVVFQRDIVSHNKMINSMSVGQYCIELNMTLHFHLP